MTQATKQPYADSSAFGTLGEKHVDFTLSKFFYSDGKPIFLFDVRFMGEKAHLLDFLVRLTDEEAADKTRAEYFFAQIKTVHSEKSVKFSKAKEVLSIDVEVTQKDVYQAQCMHAPVYVIAVDARNPEAIRAYVAGISSFRKTGVYSVRTAFPLESPDTLRALKTEVIGYFGDRPQKTFTSKFDNAIQKETTDAA